MTNQNLKTCSSSGFCPKNGIIIPTIMIIREVLQQVLEIIREIDAPASIRDFKGGAPVIKEMHHDNTYKVLLLEYQLRNKPLNFITEAFPLLYYSLLA